MKKFGLTGNQLKIIALVLMTVDHIGLIFMPQRTILRLIGRLAFPVFAYMIAEGCRHTRSMGRYFGLMAGVGVACQIVDYLISGSLYQCILITFSLSVMLIWLLRRAQEKKTAGAWLAVIGGIVLTFTLTRILPVLLAGTDYDIDYGFWGIMLPVLVYLGKGRWQKLGLTAVALLLIGMEIHWIQFFALLALPLLALYNGQRGKRRMKYLFYIYYPAHLAVLHLISML